MSKKETEYPFNLVDKANKDIREYGYRLRILIDEDEWYYNVEILTVDENDQITDVYEFAENMFESELADCVNDAWANVKERVRMAEEEKEKQKRDKLLHETIAILSADLFDHIYSPDVGLGSSETAAEIISLAEKFEQELNWQGPDNETRDYILELDKFESKVLKERGYAMDSSRLTRLQESSRCRLEYAILQFVKEHGDDLTDYDINEFGLGEREDEGTITKVWNFFDNGGCYFPLTKVNTEFDIQEIRNNQENPDETWETDKAIDVAIDNTFEYSAYQCLYIVVDENRNERLKYYRLYNCGACFDDEGSEPDHDYVSTLSLVDLCFLVEAIKLNPEQP